jgi:glycosyltransferase involved in cell wall biosynthesis
MSVYLDRYAYPPLQIESKPIIGTALIIVIPVFNEPNLLVALNSLLNSSMPDVPIEVLVVINQSESCDEKTAAQNRLTFEETNDWILANSNKRLSFYVRHISFAKKHAGVGLARKAGMDEAVRRFEAIGNDKGIILCYDADCTCSRNYLSAVYHFFTDKELNGASIYYEHKTDHLSGTDKEGIVQYELHLRYYANGLRKAGYPYAFHTVGSSMAVRADIYKKAGGMNRRKAGEDFHFLHKVIPFGNFDEINSTSVYPSARISTRVPFGTGKAMEDWNNQNKPYFESYHPRIFIELALFLKRVPNFYRCTNLDNEIQELPSTIQAYLIDENFIEVLNGISKQSNNLKTFIHRWFAWFNGLRTLHLVHYLRDNRYPSISIVEAAKQLIVSKKSTAEELLKEYRLLDKQFTADQIGLKHLYP